MLMKDGNPSSVYYSLLSPKLKKEIKHLATMWYDIVNIADKRR